MGYWSGKKILPEKYAWLIEPMRQVNGIGDKIIQQMADAHNLTINIKPNGGLLPSIQQLQLTADEKYKLSLRIRDFYEKMATYDLQYSCQWNLVFYFLFGWFSVFTVADWIR